ncbi:scarecrow transcription factor family protein [Striga asiatica]|uniref:Scarecrow transcription factor family protein n=1 Tax=Striga asiatica TaxID=4170 RepID=A0A5A7PCB7_STRAF|nr:scarecrow transcription factor family protein [Striga asiatica]
MLAGCSSTLLSPRHRLRSESSGQFQACHNIPTMSTQRLDLPCSFVRKDGPRPQPVRPVGLSIVDKPVDAKPTGCSLWQNIKLPPTPTEKVSDFWDKGRSSKKRYAAEEVIFDEESHTNRTERRKRARGSPKQEQEDEEGHLRNFGWFHPGSCSVDENQEELVVASPLPPLSSIPWLDSTAIKCPESRDSSGSSSSSGGGSGNSSRQITVLGPPGHSFSGPKPGNASSPPEPAFQPPHHHNGGTHNHHHSDEHECVELVSLLVSCADQIGSRKNPAAAATCLLRLGHLASPRGPSAVHRLAAYFTEALALRASRLWPQVFHFPPQLDWAHDENEALRVLNQVSPIPRFVHFTSNEILLRAFEGKSRVHVIDFDAGLGLQFPGLLQSLVSRPDPPTHVRITGVGGGGSKQELVETFDSLDKLAAEMNLPFELRFHAVVDRLEDVRRWMLHVKEGESVAVSCVFQLHKLLYDSTGGSIRDFLGVIRSTNPEVVVLAEQEGEHDGSSLESRLCNALRYYAAIFDSVDASLPLGSVARVRVEEMFGRGIRNIIACEGRERVERHRGFEKWREVMRGSGFRSVGIGEREVMQGEMMVRMYSSGEGLFRVERKEENGSGCVRLSWLDQPLYSVSGWVPEDRAGGSTLAS